MATPYTAGDWFVREGHEDGFVAAWQEMAAWTASEVPGSRWAVLLRDGEDPRHFLSVGPWDGADAIEAWRALPGFGGRISRIRGLLERFVPHTLTEAAAVGTLPG